MSNYLIKTADGQEPDNSLPIKNRVVRKPRIPKQWLRKYGKYTWMHQRYSMSILWTQVVIGFGEPTNTRRTTDNR